MKRLALLKLSSAMTIFGTIGIFVRYINLPSGFLAMVRGFLGVLFTVGVTLLSKKKIDFAAVKSKLPLLAFCGAAIGVNWILLFESYRYTTVATTTLCYYIAPVFVILASPLVLGERIGLKKGICVLVALLGMVFVSGIIDVGVNDISELRGILLGLGAAVLYASVTLMNKKLGDAVSASDRTAIQLFFATVVIIPYTLIAEEVCAEAFSTTAIILLLVVGLVHTGFSYTLFFGSIKDLSAQTVAIFGYLDPIVAILLSALLLKEPMTPLAIVGAVLIIASTFVAEFPIGSKKKSQD